jgi:hypothetical protein
MNLLVMQMKSSVQVALYTREGEENIPKICDAIPRCHLDMGIALRGLRALTFLMLWFTFGAGT